MKVYIGPFRSWIGPYQIAEALCFWVKDVKDEYGHKSKPDWVFNFGTWLGENKDGSDSRLTKFCQWIDKKKKRKIKIHIDNYDVWSMENTLALIILPMLKKLKEVQHGYPNVDVEDVPYNLQVTERGSWDSQMDLFDFPIAGEGNLGEDRWNWVLNEIIFAFECKVDDSWQEAYRSGEIDLRFEKREDGLSLMVKGPNDTYNCDYEGMMRVEDRIANGFRLFGKYYQALWD
jgi:hypothetical protein